MIRFAAVGLILAGACVGWSVGAMAEFKAALAGATAGAIVGLILALEAIRFMRR